MDGTGDSVERNALIKILHGRVISIAYGPGEGRQGEEGFLDCGHYTVLPGLVDTHVHLSLPAPSHIENAQQRGGTDFPNAASTIESRLRNHLLSGVVAVRDGGDREADVLKHRLERSETTGVPVRLKAAGQAWHSPGRYGSIIGRPPAPGLSLSDAIGNQTPKPDHVKIINSGINSLSVFGKETPPQFDYDQLESAVRAAKARGLSSMVHANGYAPVRDAVNAGCDSVEHGFFMGRENMDRMASRKTTWVPTACAMSALALILQPGSGEAAGARRNLEHQIHQIAQAEKAGVMIALGTDSGSPGVIHGQWAAMEIQAFLDAGMSVREAIKCATWNGAMLLGLEHVTGKLVPGMPATFLVASGGPDRMAESLKRPAAVYVNGIRRVP